MDDAQRANGSPTNDEIVGALLETYGVNTMDEVMDVLRQDMFFQIRADLRQARAETRELELANLNPEPLNPLEINTIRSFENVYPGAAEQWAPPMQSSQSWEGFIVNSATQPRSPERQRWVVAMPPGSQAIDDSFGQCCVGVLIEHALVNGIKQVRPCLRCQPSLTLKYVQHY